MGFRAENFRFYISIEAIVFLIGCNLGKEKVGGSPYIYTAYNYIVQIIIKDQLRWLIDSLAFVVGRSMLRGGESKFSVRNANILHLVRPPEIQPCRWPVNHYRCTFLGDFAMGIPQYRGQHIPPKCQRIIFKNYQRTQCCVLSWLIMPKFLKCPPNTKIPPKKAGVECNCWICS